MADTFARSDKKMVTGLFPDRTSAETAYQAVTERGYSRDDVNLVMSDDARQRHFGAAAGTETELGTKAASGAGIGGAIGGSLGAIAAAIAAVGTSLVVPGLGLVVAGPLAAAIVGAGAGGATGGILGALIGYGIPEERVKHYEEGIRNGGILMGVTPRSDEDALHFHHKWTESRGEHVLSGAGSTIDPLSSTAMGDAANHRADLRTDIGDAATARTDLRTGAGADLRTGMATGLGAGSLGALDATRPDAGEALDTRVSKFESHESARPAQDDMIADMGSGMHPGAMQGGMRMGSGGGMGMNMQSGAGNMAMQSGGSAAGSQDMQGGSNNAGNSGKFNAAPGALAEATLAGGAAAAFDPSAEDAYWRGAHQREPYYRNDYSYEDYAPAYKLGYGSRQHSDQSFDYSEPMLRSQWESVKGSSRLSWEEAKDATRAAWNRIT